MGAEKEFKSSSKRNDTTKTWKMEKKKHKRRHVFSNIIIIIKTYLSYKFDVIFLWVGRAGNEDGTEPTAMQTQVSIILNINQTTTEKKEEINFKFL
jgi:hypothetical protein